MNGFNAKGGMSSKLRRPDTQVESGFEFPGGGGQGGPPNGGGGNEYGGGGASLEGSEGSSASYPNMPTPPTTGTPPSPEAILSGGLMNASGTISSPTAPTSPTPVGTMGPVMPNTLPSPSPRALTNLSGSAGGLLGGGMGVAGSTGLDRAQSSPLLALLAALQGGQ